MRRNLKYVSNVLLIGGFLALLGLTWYHTPITNEEEYSFYENRNLALPPEYNSEDFWSGQYCTDWETYLKDHIAGRDWMLEQYTRVSRDVLKKPVVGEILKSSDGKKLMPLLGFGQEELTEEEAAAQEMASRLSTLNELVSSYGGKFLYVGVPEQEVYFQEQYPFYAYNQAESWRAKKDIFCNALAAQGIPFLDMGQVFDDMGHPDWVYSNTDHHYNYYGAFYTYQAIIQTINQEREQLLPVLGKSDLDFQALPNPFIGSRNRKWFGQFETEDQLIMGILKQEIPFRRYIMGNEVAPELYAIPETTDEWVTYDCYNGGDRAECIIETDREELPTLLLFGDSFTNPLETLLYTSFDKSIYVDLREINYLTQGILAYVEQYHPDYVVCVRDNSQFLNLTGNGVISYENTASHLK